MTIRDFLRLFAHVQLMPVLESGEEILVGGQAVVEGVMMRAPHSYCVAVRKPNGEIITEEAPLARLSERYPIFKLPLLRGLGTLGQAMTLGLKALRFSANAALTEDEAAQTKQVSSGMMTAQLILSLLFTFVMYKFVPLALTRLLETQYPALHGQFLNALVDGLIRLTIFFGFLFTISRFEDIRRIFQYHGAEHKVVFNYESGRPVSVENAQKFSTLHPRCGTSFLLVVMILSMLVYMLVPVQGFGQKLLARAILLPFIAGLSYEVIRFAARRQGSLLALISAPGLWLQNITTQPPSDAQAAVAIHALDGAMALEAKQGGELVIA